MSGQPQTTGREDPADDGQATFRYGVVFLLMLSVVVVTILAPAARWSRAVLLAIQGVALLVAIATARTSRARRRERMLAAGALLAIVVAGTAAGVASRGLTGGISALFAAAVPVAIVGGVARLVRERGVTLQAVLGALAIYLSVGLVFAGIIGLAAQVGSPYYFAQGTNGSESDHVYFSFTVLTTTGFGDFTAAKHFGRALAVVEMLTGQLYLVTVIGVLVGNMVGRQRPG